MSKRSSVPLDEATATSSSSAGPSNMTADDNFVVVPSREEKRKQRKMEKQKPQFQYDVSWFRGGKKVGIAHIRDMLLYILADAQRPSWIIPEHKGAIAHTVVLFVPGLLPGHLGLAPIPLLACLPFSTTPQEAGSFTRIPIIKKLFTYGCPTRAPGDQRKLHSVTGTFMSSPLPDHVRKQKEEEGRKAAAVARAEGSTPFTYLLTPNQMLDNDYRLPLFIPPSDTRIIPGLDLTKLGPELAAMLAHKEEHGDMGTVPDSYTMPAKNGISNGGLPINGKSDKGWVETPQAEASTMAADELEYPIMALDCEMVLTEDGQELARVSVIDYQSGVNVYDHFVKPSKPVKDYRTQWSGITAEKLSDATKTLSTIQQDLITGPTPLIKPNTILLGHSLECDLTAMKIRHPLCIDTAIIFKHPRGPPYKPGLKWLAQRWMNKEIQANSSGHDSEEDARACVELLKLKMANGPDFGSFQDTSESIFDRMNRYVPDAATKKGRKTAYCDFGNPKSSMGGKATTVERCTTDKEVIDAVSKHSQDHDFVFGRLMELAQVQGWDHRHASETLEMVNGSEAIEQALDNLNERITRLHDSLPGNTALVVFTGHSNPLPMLELAQKRQKWERIVKTVDSFEDIPKEDRWLSEDDRELEKATAEAREGMAFFCVKR